MTLCDGHYQQIVFSMVMHFTSIINTLLDGAKRDTDYMLSAVLMHWPKVNVDVHLSRLLLPELI